MRIVSIKWEPVSRILAVVYAVFGFGTFIIFAFSNTQNLVLPFGVVAPLIQFSFNLHLPRSTDLYYNAFFAVAAVISWAVTGWVTGAVATLSFNFVAKRIGGIDAKYFSVVDETEPAGFNNPGIQ